MLRKVKICPSCNREYTGYPAISRKDNKTKICSNCGQAEEAYDYVIWQQTVPNASKR